MEYESLENDFLNSSNFEEINYGGPGDDPKPAKKQSSSGSGLDLPKNQISKDKSFDSKTKGSLKQLANIADSNPELKQRNKDILLNMQYQEQAKKVDKLTDDQNQIVSGLLKQYNLNPSQAASYSHGAIKDYVDTSLKLNYYDSRNPDKAEEKRANVRLANAIGVWENVLASLDNGKQWVDEGINKWTWLGGKGDVKGTGISQEKYNTIKSKMRKYEEPIVSSELDKEKSEYEQLSQKTEAAKKRMVDFAAKNKGGAFDIYKKGFSAMTEGTNALNENDREAARLQQEYSRLTKAQAESEHRMSELGSYLENKDSLWDGFDNVDYSRIVGTGLVDAFATYTVKNKVKNGQQLTEADNEFLMQKAKTEKFKQTTKQTIDRDRFWTRTGEGTGESGVFMGQMVVTAPLGGAGGAVVKSIVSPLASKIAMSAAIKSAGMVEGRLASKALEVMATKGIGYIESGVIGSGELLTQSFGMPSTYENMSRKFIGQTSLITDKDGNEKILLTSSAKKAFEKQSQNSLNILNEEEKRLNTKKELSEDDIDRLNQISLDKHNINQNLNAVYQVRTGKDGKQEYYIPEDISSEDAFIYGYTESLKEMAAERYVGTLGKPISRLAGKAYTSTLGKTMIGKKIISPIGNATSKFWGKGQEFVNGKFGTQLGLLSNNLSYHTGGAKIFHNLPGEVMEEIAVQLTPTYTEDYKRQLKELGNPNFYVDVIAQTLLMGAGFGSVATGKHLGSYTFNKDYRQNIKDLRVAKREISELYRNIDTAVDDNDLAVHIGMNTGDTSFNIQDYQSKVAELRNSNDFAEANRLEQNTYLNLGLRALRTDTLSEYKEKLQNIADSDKFSNDTRQNATTILETLPKLEEVRNKYSNRINYGSIVDKAINNIIYDKSKAEINNKINELRKSGTDILNNINKFEPSRLETNVDDTIDSITIDDIQYANLSEMTKEKVDKINSLLAEHEELGQLVELNHVNDVYDFVNYENNKQLKYELNPANYNEIRRQHIQERNRQLVNTVNEDNVDEVKNELEETGELTPEVNSQINQAVEANVIETNNNVPATPITEVISDVELTAPDTQQVIDKDTSTLPEAAKESAASEFTRIAEDTLFDEPTVELASPDAVQEAKDNDALTLQPLNLDDSSKQKSVIDQYTKVLNDLNSNINEQLGRDLTPKEAFGLFANSVGLQVAEQHYNLFKKAFENTNITNNENWNNLYNKYFEPLSKFNFGINEVIETPTTVEEVITDDQQTNKEIAETNTPTAYTQENNPIKYLGRKISVAMNKIPFLGVKYKAVINPLDNTVTYIDDTDGELNTDGSSNLNIVLNPDILVPGKTFDLEIPTDWRTRTVSEWTRNEGGFLVQNAMTMEEWMNKNNVVEGSKEWIDKVPMDMILDGNNIGYGVHDTSWWNTRNVADFKDATIGDETLSEEQAKQQQNKVIEKGRELTSVIRNAVFSGNTQMVITEREEGHTLTNKNNELKNLHDSNPNTQITIGSPQGFITDKTDNGNQYFKGVVVNQNNIEKGHVYMISRLGTTVVDNKIVPTYVAHKVITNHNQDSLNELAKSRQRMYDAADILNGTGKFQDASQEQVAWANRVKDQVRAMTGISIDNVAVTGTSVQYTGLGELRQLYPLPVKNDKGLMLLPQVNNFNKQKLPIVHQDGSVTNYKSNAGEGYKAMLMDNLYTQKKFHTITDNAGNTQYVLDVQPRIKFELNNKEAQTVEVEQSAPGLENSSISELFHTSNSVLTLDDISVEPRQTRQGRRGQYGGFYTYDNLEDIEKFAQGNNSANIHKITLVPGTQITEYAGSIERLDKDTLGDLRSQGIKIIKGKSLFGKTEIIIIDKSAIASVELNSPVEEVASIDTITTGQKRRVIQYLFNNILASVDISKDFTDRDIVNKIKDAYQNHLTQIEGTPEYEYLVENRDSILGLNEFSTNDNTVKSELESFLSQTFEIENDVDTGIETETEVNMSDEGIFEKNQNKAAFENDVRTSLSTKMKMFFSGIIKDNKNVTEQFAGLQEYYTSDEVIGALQDMLVNVSNDPKSFKDKIQSQVDKNPEEFGFLQQVLDKFNSANIEIQKEILFRLNQTKNEMFFVMYSKNKSSRYTLMVYDANSRNPNIKTKIDWQENLKQSPILLNFGDTYRLRENAATQAIEQFKGWKNNHQDVPNQEYIDWLANFGIQVSDKTIQDYKDGIVEGNTNFEANFTGGIFNVLAQNLETALKKQVQNANTVFKYRAESKNDSDAFNILTDNNNGYIKTMVDVEVNNTFNLASSMYIAGKTINAYSQPNYTSEQLRKLKDFNNPLAENLRQSAFSRNSLLLDLLSNNTKIKNSLNLGYISLQALKQQGQKVYQDSGIVDLSGQDYDLLLQGFFQSEGAYFVNQELKNKGIALREIKMSFPTLSDSSQMFVFNTVGLNLNKGNFNITESGDMNINEEVLELMYSQLVKPDLDRIHQFMSSNKKINIQGHNLGSQIFTMLPNMNTLPIDINGTDVKFLSVVHDRIKKGATIDDIYNEFKTDIHRKINDTIKANVENKIRLDGIEIKGTWVDNGFLDEKQNANFLDSKYLNSRGSTNTIEQLQIAAFDYAINYYLNQAQIQMLFAGDINNYVQDKQEKKFNKDNNGIDVTRPIVSVGLDENQLEVEQKIYNDIIKATSVNMSKRLKELISPGNRIANSKGESYIQLMLNDVEESSTTLEQIVKQFYPELYQDNKAEIAKLKNLENEIKKGIQNNESVKLLEDEYSAISKKLQGQFPDIADYFNITATDAQEYTTWQEHLHILLNQGRVNQGIYDSLFDKLKSQSENGINVDNKLTKEEKKIVFQPIKPLHAGMYFEDLYNNNNEVIGKNQRYVYVKTSSFPLLPEMTSGLELDNLRKNIETLENKTGKKVRVSYQSGNKVGAVKSAINISELYNDNYNSDLENKMLGSSLTLERDNFSIQQDKPFKTDKNIKNNKRDEINRGTQFEKIILGNGINKITDKIFPFNGELISGVELYDNYTKFYNQEQKVLKNQLYNSLGLNLNGDWNNSVETLEHIKSALDKRLSNKQDKEILDLSYIVPTVENGKLTNKYYTKAEVQEQGLKPTSAEFNIPIWMSPNSRKFESVLNSIVNNKLVNLKLPGFSSPVASQEGFKIKEESDIKDVKGIVTTENYDATQGLKATHNSDGSLKYAQVMVASKFRVKKKGENGKYTDELIDLSTYTKTLEDGRIVLDMERVSPELLQMFSFRIPTSAHQSGALIEIVGFLPHSQGDLMIVPKDHTTQIGEDYDIDTRYVYTQNYRVDNKGNIRKIDDTYVQNRIENLDNSFANETEWNQQSEDILNIFDEFRNNEEIQNIFTQDNISRERKHQILKDSLQHLLIENNIVDIYKSVFASTNDKIQKMIGSTLSTKFAEDTAEAIDNELNSAKDDSNFSIFDDAHQKSILRLGASGKLGIGVHSNWVVLNSLFQQMKEYPQIVQGYNEETGTPFPWNMTIGNFTSNGKLGQINALQPNSPIKGFVPRLLSVINMESQNSSTDNQKLQIMGRRNENKYTINAFALMSNLGFDKDIVNGQEMSLPSLFISQPIIRRYVELKENFDSIMTDYQENIDDEIVNTLLKEFGNGVDIVETDFGPKMSSDQMKIVEKTELTAQKLYEGLLNGSNAQQWAVFEKFVNLNQNAANITKVQQLANIDSSGLGVSYFNTIDKKNTLVNMNDEDLNIDGVSRLFGNRIWLNNEQIENREQALLNDGYIRVEQNSSVTAYIKPTSPLSAKLVNAISTGYNLWNNVLPFEDEFIDNQINEVLRIAGKENGTKATTELKYKIISDMKDYIYSYSNLGIFDGTVDAERARLFMDNDNNESLASYLNKLKKAKNDLFNQPFFKELEFVLNRGNEASLIKYSSNDRTAYNKNAVHNQLNMLNDSLVTLPDFNGRTYTHEMLAKDLTKYALLSNQENGAIGFRQHIPMTILNKYNVTENLRKYSGVGQNLSHNLLLNGDFKALMRTVGASTVLDNTIRVYRYTPVVDGLIERINTKYGTGSLVYDALKGVINVNNIDTNNFNSIFTKQFFQHNPEQARKLNHKNNKQWLNESNDKALDKLQWFTVKTHIDTPEFYSIRDSKNSTFLLFELDSNGIYRKINTLGSFGLNEYSPFTYNAQSLIENNNVAKDNIQTVKPIQVGKDISLKDMIENHKINNGLLKFMDNIPTDSKFKDIAELVKPFMGDTKINVIDLKGMGNALYVPLSENDGTVSTDVGQLNRGEIYVSEDLVKSGNTEKMNYAIMEEAIHSVTVNEVNKYIDTSKSYLDKDGNINLEYKTDEIPAHIVKLVSLFKQGSKHILNNMATNSSLEEAVKRINDQKQLFNNLSKGIQTNTDTVEPIGENFKRNVYRTLNLGEFIAGVMLDDTFRTEMNNLQYRSTGKSILSQFAEVIAKIVDKLSNSKRVPGSVTAHTFDAVMALLQYEQSAEVNNSSPVTQSKVTEQMQSTDIEAENFLNELESPDTIRIVPTENKTSVNDTPVLKSKLSGFKVLYVPRQVQEEAYKNDFNNQNRTGGPQSIDTIIQRGGYSIEELNSLLPNWRNGNTSSEISLQPTSLSDITDFKKKGVYVQFLEQMMEFFPENVMTVDEAMKLETMGEMDERVYKIAKMLNSKVYVFKNSEAELKAMNQLPQIMKDTLLNEDLVATYPNGGVDIFVNLENSIKHKDKHSQNILAHELAHVFTAKIFSAKMWELEPYQRDFRKAISKAATVLQKRRHSSMEEYGFTEPTEFIAEYLSSKNFRNLVDKRYNSFSGKVKRFMAKVLGQKTISPTELEQVFNAYLDETETNINNIITLNDTLDIPTC